MTSLVLTSDVHLTPGDPTAFGDWMSCVEHAITQATSPPVSVLVLGDLWDFYIHGHSYFRRHLEEWTKKTLEWDERGIRWTCLEGNHDLYLPETQKIEVVGRNKLFLTHGDTFNQLDRGYLRLKSILHAPMTRAVARHIPGRLLAALARRMSHASRNHWAPSKKWTWDDYESQLLPRIEEWKLEGISTVVFGHCHWLKDVMLNGVRVINLGYYPRDRRVLLVQETGIDWVIHPIKIYQ